MDLSIKSMKENWKNKSTAQKVGTVAAGVAATAAVASVVAAGVLGGRAIKADAFEPAQKFLNKDGQLKGIKKLGAMFAEGYKAIGKGIAGAWNTAAESVTGLFNKIFKKDVPAQGEANVAEVVGEVVEEFVEEVAEQV